MRSPILNRAFDTTLFYGGWVWCLNDAALDQFFYGSWSVLAIILYQLYRSPHRRADTCLLFLVGGVGPLSDVLYSYLGLLHYHSPVHNISWLPPLWIFLLWGLVSVHLPLFSWLKKKWLLATLLGAVGGPASYLSAVRLGGASLLKPLPLTLIVIGGMWAIFFPSLMWLNDQFKVWFKS